MADHAGKLELLRNKIHEVDGLLSQYNKPGLTQWISEVNLILENIISKDSKHYQQFNEVGYSPSVVFMGEDNDEAFYEAYCEGLLESRAILNSLVFGIEKELI